MKMQQVSILGPEYSEVCHAVILKINYQNRTLGVAQDVETKAHSRQDAPHSWLSPLPFLLSSYFYFALWLLWKQGAP